MKGDNSITTGGASAAVDDENGFNGVIQWLAIWADRKHDCRLLHGNDLQFADQLSKKKSCDLIIPIGQICALADIYEKTLEAFPDWSPELRNSRYFARAIKEIARAGSFSTRQGLWGLGPMSLAAGDSVWLVPGGGLSMCFARETRHQSLRVCWRCLCPRVLYIENMDHLNGQQSSSIDYRLIYQDPHQGIDSGFSALSRTWAELN